jgi:hypothetical protein
MSSSFIESPTGPSERPPPQPPPGSDQPTDPPPGDMHDADVARGPMLAHRRRHKNGATANAPVAARMSLFPAAWSECGRGIRTR